MNSSHKKHGLIISHELTNDNFIPANNMFYDVTKDVDKTFRKTPLVMTSAKPFGPISLNNVLTRNKIRFIII